MRGSIIECMAETIQRSQFTLMRMLNKYKMSINCKARDEYTLIKIFYLLSNLIIGLMDIWVFWLIQKFCTDFTGKEREEFEKAYIL